MPTQKIEEMWSEEMFKGVPSFRLTKTGYSSNKINIMASAIGLMALVSSTAAIFGWLPLDCGPAGFIIFFLSSALRSWAE